MFVTQFSELKYGFQVRKVGMANKQFHRIQNKMIKCIETPGCKANCAMCAFGCCCPCCGEISVENLERDYLSKKKYLDPCRPDIHPQLGRAFHRKTGKPKTGYCYTCNCAHLKEDPETHWTPAHPLYKKNRTKVLPENMAPAPVAQDMSRGTPPIVEEDVKSQARIWEAQPTQCGNVDDAELESLRSWGQEERTQHKIDIAQKSTTTATSATSNNIDNNNSSK
jgi:hypothetical protein